MKNIPTAEEYIFSKLNPQRSGRTDVIEIDYAIEIMIEYTKLHTKAALESVIIKVDNERVAPYPTNSEMRNSYPLSNIK